MVTIMAKCYNDKKEFIIIYIYIYIYISSKIDMCVVFIIRLKKLFVLS